MSFIKIEPSNFKNMAMNLTVAFFSGKTLIEFDAPGDLIEKIDSFLEDYEVDNLCKMKFVDGRTFCQIWLDMNNQEDRTKKYELVQDFMDTLYEQSEDLEET